jgi:hypothetical protein
MTFIPLRTTQTKTTFFLVGQSIAFLLSISLRHAEHFGFSSKNRFSVFNHLLQQGRTAGPYCVIGLILSYGRVHEKKITLGSSRCARLLNRFNKKKP